MAIPCQAVVQKLRRNMGEIYKITNLINGKIYIGQTKNDARRRWTEHKRDAKKHSYHSLLHSAINKYGEENFRMEVIENNVPEEKLNEKEIYWIKYYDTFDNPEKGYNLTSGGGQNFRITEKTRELHRIHALTGVTGHKHLPREQVYTPEVRKRMSEIGKKKTISAETRRKMAESNRGKKPSPKALAALKERNKNLIWSEESKKKLSESMKRYLSNKENHNFYGKFGAESARHITVYQYDLKWNFICKYGSKKEALESLGLKGHNEFNKAIKNKTIYKGYYWTTEDVETIEINQQIKSS